MPKLGEILDDATKKKIFSEKEQDKNVIPPKINKLVSKKFNLLEQTKNELFLLINKYIFKVETQYLYDIVNATTSKELRNILFIIKEKNHLPLDQIKQQYKTIAKLLSFGEYKNYKKSKK